MALSCFLTGIPQAQALTSQGTVLLHLHEIRDLTMVFLITRAHVHSVSSDQRPAVPSHWHIAPTYTGSRGKGKFLTDTWCCFATLLIVHTAHPLLRLGSPALDNLQDPHVVSDVRGDGLWSPSSI